MGHELTPGALALPTADQTIDEPLSDPCAIPLTFKSFAHVALNDPFAIVEVCSVTVHLKSVQEEADGATLVEDHVPMSALRPDADGPVCVLVCSNPKQPAAIAAALTARPQAKRRFFIAVGEGFAGSLGRGEAVGRVCRPAFLRRIISNRSARSSFQFCLVWNAPNALQVIAQCFARAAERQFVPWNLIGLKEPCLQTFLVTAELAADHGSGIDDDDG
jgi:hypothetical protein